MLVEYSPERLRETRPDQLGDELESGAIVFFPQSPVPLPDADDQHFLRDQLPDLLKRKNVSYHPETDRVGIKGAPELATRTRQLLKTHSAHVDEFLRQAMPTLTQDYTVGTSSFRPIQEKGRNLSAHASNELVHIDAGAYGATNGDRILRFFVNLNPTEDRVWATKGTFPDLYRRYGDAAGVTPARRKPVSLDKNISDRMRTTFLRAVAGAGVPQAILIDSSPYDRTMRQFHNFMKDTPGFQQDMSTHEEMRFPPFSAWMVLTDMVSHASLSGQYALVNTFLLRLASCRQPQNAPYNILSAAA